MMFSFFRKSPESEVEKVLCQITSVGVFGVHSIQLWTTIIICDMWVIHVLLGPIHLSHQKLITIQYEIIYSTEKFQHQILQNLGFCLVCNLIFI